MIKSPKIVVCHPFFGIGWRWFSAEYKNEKLEWFFFDAKARNFPEKNFKQADLAFIRAAYQAVSLAKNQNCSLLISHDPRLTLWCSIWIKFLKVPVDHVAYCFNFPELPTGLKRAVMTNAFKTIDRFIVFSMLERQIYSDYFGIPQEKFTFSFWSVDKPKIEPKEALEKGDYICALGGNARDYPTLMEAMSQLKNIKLVLVTRAENLKELEIPPNVKCLVNIPFGQAMNILSYSRFIVLPLKNSAVPCGHVTIVAAMHCSKAMIVTDSQGVIDYLKHDYNGVLCEPKNSEAMTELISELWNNSDKCQELGDNGYKFAQKFCSEEFARQELHNLLVEKGLICAS